MPSWKFRKKLRFDWNSLQDQGAGFGKPTNKVTFIDKYLNIEPMELKSKKQLLMIFYKSKKSFIEISETVCNTNARFEQLPTVLQQYKSTDEKILFLLLLLLDLQRHNNWTAL
jgi:hypothetical protein